MLRKSLSRLFGKPAAIQEDLDAFVVESDRLGGPGHPDCEAYWRGFAYHPVTKIDQQLDPYSHAYCEQQLALYRELSGRHFDQAVNEHTWLDVAKHAAAPNPYDHPDPAGLALHIIRLAKAIRLAGIRRDGELLDMGAGWGLSSEVAAYVGLRVTAVDINPLFINLIRTRVGKSRLPIEAVASAFEDFEPRRTYDGVLFYECLHHALRPWDLLERLASNLTVDGRFILAGEPINSLWWKHWGMRLDPLSIYCIRKFGWFETGWSISFVQDMFERMGFIASVTHDPDGEVGVVVVARRASTYDAKALMTSFAFSTGAIDSGYVVFGEPLSLNVIFPSSKRTFILEVHNFRPKVISGSIISPTCNTPFRLEPGPGTLRLERDPSSAAEVCFTIDAEVWKPCVELSSADPRTLSFHIKCGSFA